MAGVLLLISSKITLTKEKETKKRKSEEEERRKREKSNGYTLSFYIAYFGGSFWPSKNCLTKDVYLVVTFSKIRKFIFPYVLSLFSRRSPVVSSLA